MRAHLVQLDIQWEAPQSNYERVRLLVEQTDTKPGDLIALPELFDSGFTLNTTESCDTNNSGSSTTRMCWHTSNNRITSGYRCGGSILNGNNGWERLVYTR